MRPRSVERGKVKEMEGVREKSAASMRPRSVERGKSSSFPIDSRSPKCFNEAALSRARKGGRTTRNTLPFTGLNAAAISRARKAMNAIVTINGVELLQ